MVTKYQFHSAKLGGNIKIGFNGAGVISYFELDELELTKEMVQVVLSNLHKLPTQAEFLSHCTKNKIQVFEIKPDLSFEAFWNAYGYKVGSKVDAMKLWDKLSDADKTLAMKNIVPYKNFSDRKNTAYAYPERYLRKRYFDNPYNLMK